jgi:alginate O-acetyltransferase complex protein AlgI
MIFTSFSFLVFFILLYLVYWSCKSQKTKEILLLVFSILFYASWSIGFLFHFLFFISLNYYFLKKLYETKSKSIISIAIITNLLNLGIFKYFYFFTNTFYQLSGIQYFYDLENSFSFKIILPLAISFYTFQILAFLIDVYRGKETKQVSLFEFSLFILFFPQLIAGPIMRTNEFIPELRNIQAKEEYIKPGIFLIALGVIKKVLIADNLSLIVDPVWANVSEYSTASIILAVNGFTWQIYCDFSGYTDIARGCAYLLGFKIPENFLSPFLSCSMREVWQRWHITLSTWLRDYIYFSLGGNKVSEKRTYLNQILTFTLGGFWHGANFTYIFWGFFHGAVLVLESIFQKKGWFLNPENFFIRILANLYTYHVFMFGAIMFRANSIGDMILSFQKYFGLKTGELILKQDQVNTCIGLCIITFIIQTIHYKQKLPNWILRYEKFLLPIFCFLVFYLVSLYSKSGKQFIYYKF